MISSHGYSYVYLHNFRQSLLNSGWVGTWLSRWTSWSAPGTRWQALTPVQWLPLCLVRKINSWFILKDTEQFLGWLLFGGVVFLVSHLIYSSLGTVETEEPSFPSPKPDIVPSFSVSSPPQSSHPVAVGSDPDCVAYANRCLDFIYSRQEVQQEILSLWRENLTQFASRSAIEVSIEYDYNDWKKPRVSISYDYQNSKEERLSIDHNYNDWKSKTEHRLCSQW